MSVIDPFDVYNENNDVAVVEGEGVVLVGRPGPQGAVGPAGPPGTGLELFIQNAAPVTAETKYLWIETGLAPGGTGFTFWFAEP